MIPYLQRLLSKVIRVGNSILGRFNILQEDGLESCKEKYRTFDWKRKGGIDLEGNEVSIEKMLLRDIKRLVECLEKLSAYHMYFDIDLFVTIGELDKSDFIEDFYLFASLGRLNNDVFAESLYAYKEFSKRLIELHNKMNVIRSQSFFDYCCSELFGR